MKTDYITEYRRIRRRLHVLLHLRRAVHLLEGVGLTMMACGAVLAGIALWDHIFHLPLGIRIPAAAAFYTFLGLLVHRWVIIAVRRCGGLQETALHVESRHKDMDQSLEGSVEFMREQVDPAIRDTDVPEVFLEGMVHDAHNRSRAIRTRDVATKREFVRAALAFAVPLAMLLVAIRQMPGAAGVYGGRILAPGLRERAPLSSVIMEVAPGNTKLIEGESATLSLKTPSRAPSRAILFTRRHGAQEWSEETLLRGEDNTYTKVLGSVDESFDYRFRLKRDYSDAFTVSVVKIPEIVGFALDYRYPGYTGREHEGVRAGDGNITALRGTEVRIKVVCDRPLAGAQVVFEEKDPLHFKPAGADWFDFSLQVSESLHYRITLEDVEGTPGQSPTSYTVTPLTDERPEIEVKLPTDNIRATSVSEVPVILAAKDDFGFSRVRLRYMVDDGEEIEHVFEAGGVRKLEAEYLFHLEDMNLQPGDQILYSVEVLDNDEWSRKNRNGYKRAVSEMQFIMVQHFKQEFMIIFGPGGQQKKMRRGELVAMERAIVRDTWPFVGVGELEDPDSEKLRSIGENQMKVRVMVDDEIAWLRYLGAPQEAIDALKKSIPLMESAAEKLRQTEPDEGFDYERKALDALLEAYSYAIKIQERSSGSGAAPPMEEEEKLEEITIVTKSSFNPDKRNTAKKLQAALPMALEDLRNKQNEITSSMKEMQAADPQAQALGKSPQPATSGQPRDPEAGPLSQRPLSRGEKRATLRREEELLERRTAKLTADVKQAMREKDAAPQLRDIAELLERSRRHMKGAAGHLSGSALPEQAVQESESAADALLAASEEARKLDTDPEQELAAIFNEIEQLRADYEMGRAADQPAEAMQRAAQRLDGLAKRLRKLPPQKSGNLRLKLEEAVAELQRMAGKNPGSGEVSLEQGGPAGNEPPADGGKGAIGKSDPNAPLSGRSSERSSGGGGTGGGKGGAPAPASESNATEASRILDLLLARFRAAPFFKEKFGGREITQADDSMEFREVENEFFRRLSEEAERP
ncbi:MAG: hypothetical protein HQ559_04285 [Lentisphaerae bacterium]|nr:hypothetical protein [Lentisphaerota bacterium]